MSGFTFLQMNPNQNGITAMTHSARFKNTLQNKFWLALVTSATVWANMSPAMAANSLVVHFVCKPDMQTFYVGTSVVDEAMAAATKHDILLDNSLTEDKKTLVCQLSKTDKATAKIFYGSPDGKNANVLVSVEGKHSYSRDLTFDAFGSEEALIISDYNGMDATHFEETVKNLKIENINPSSDDHH